MMLRPKNWSEYQHYKDRNPPWIKLHRDLLNDRDFMCLPIASKAIAPLLWLLASEAKNGEFNADVVELAFRLRMTTKEVNDGLKPLISKGFFVDASGVLADCKQLAIPETEREGEKETKKEKKIIEECPDDVDLQIWKDFISQRKAKNAVVTETAMNKIRSQASKINWSMNDALTEMCNRGWVGFNASWVNKTQDSKPAFDGRLRGAK
jgi:hypothetical protein